MRDAAIADRISAMHLLPPGVTGEAIAARDAAALAALRERLHREWSSETRVWWRRLLVRAGLVKPVMLLQTRGVVS